MNDLRKRVFIQTVRTVLLILLWYCIGLAMILNLTFKIP